MCRYSNLNGTDGCDLCIIGHAFDDNRSCRNTPYDFIQDILDTSTSKEKVTKKFISLVEDELEYLRDLKVRYLQSRRDDAKI